MSELEAAHAIPCRDDERIGWSLALVEMLSSSTWLEAIFRQRVSRVKGVKVLLALDHRQFEYQLVDHDDAPQPPRAVGCAHLPT